MEGSSAGTSHFVANSRTDRQVEIRPFRPPLRSVLPSDRENPTGSSSPILNILSVEAFCSLVEPPDGIAMMISAMPTATNDAVPTRNNSWRWIRKDAIRK